MEVGKPVISTFCRSAIKRSASTSFAPTLLYTQSINVSAEVRPSPRLANLRCAPDGLAPRISQSLDWPHRDGHRKIHFPDGRISQHRT